MSEVSGAEAGALAVQALAEWGGSDGAPRFVKLRENLVFEVHLRDGTRAALRLHRPGYQTAEAIAAEMVWTGRLAAAGVPVPEPVPTLAGALTAEAGGRIATCVRWLEGGPIGASDEPMAGDAGAQARVMGELGRLVARLHEATDALRIAPDFPRPAWDAAGLCGEAPLWGRFWENPALDAGERALLLRARDHAFAALTAFRAEGADYGLIHADVLRENVLSGPKGLALIDFDDAGFGFRMYDLGTAVVQNLEEPNLSAMVAALVAGYRAVRPLPDAAVARLPLFVALRSFASAGWIVSRMAADDPRQRFYAERAVRMAGHVLAGTAPWGAVG